MQKHLTLTTTVASITRALVGRRCKQAGRRVQVRSTDKRAVLHSNLMAQSHSTQWKMLQGSRVTGVAYTVESHPSPCLRGIQ